MALLVATNVSAPGAVPLTVNVGDVADTFPLKFGGKQDVLINNITGGPITFTFLGNNVSNVKCDGLGDPIDTSAGYSVVVGAGAKVKVNTASIRNFLTDTANLPAINATGAGAEIIITEG